MKQAWFEHEWNNFQIEHTHQTFLADADYDEYEQPGRFCSRRVLLYG